MSHANPSSKKTEYPRKMANVIDHANIDDFFNQPSAHELTATSECRVEEIIEDLKRRTAEEIKNWSWNAPIDENFKAFDLPDHTTDKTKVISDGNMVSSPVSFPSASLSSPLLSSESNCPAAIPIDSKTQSCPEPNRPTRVQGSSSSSQDELLRASDRSHEPNTITARPRISRDLGYLSSRPLVVKRGRKIPSPIPIIARDFAYQYPRTPLQDPRPQPPPPPVTPATPSAALQQIAEVERILNLRDPSKAGQPSASHEQHLISSVEGSTTIHTDKSSSPAHIGAVAPLKIKRKPLPADSPLLVSLEDHPMFAMLAPKRDGPWI